jgi:hypothetical protein
MDRWTPPATWGIGAHTHHLKNLYIYFWRWATLKVFASGWHDATGEPDIDRHGIVCFITVAGFLNGPGFQKMREDIRRDASAVWIIDCSPEGHQPHVPTRIFEGVQQPVCIVIAARAPNKNRSVPARLRFRALPEGRRQEKFAALATISLNDTAWTDGPSEWRAPFLPELVGKWSDFVPLPNLFTWSTSGVKTHRRWPIAPDTDSLHRRWTRLKSETTLDEKSRLFSPDRDRDLNRVVSVDLGPYRVRQMSVSKDRGSVMSPVRYAFRSFDRQWIIPDHRLLSMARPKLWSLDSARQTYLTALDASSPTSGPAVSFTALVPDQDHYKGSFGGRVYPLWADVNASQPNFRRAVFELLAESYGAPVSAEDVFAYVAALMAHPAFTARFAKDLVRPGLRVPLTAHAKFFAEAVALGREVVWLHCYGDRFVDPAAGRPKGPPRMPKEKAPRIPAAGSIPPAPEPLPERIDHDAAKQRLMVGKGFIENVTPAMRNYEISGKNVIDQWFSYRRRDRTKPIIGERRPPSPLEKIQPDGWLAEYTTDLLDLLNVLGRLIIIEAAQADLLARICEGPLIPREDLEKAGLIEATSQPEAAEQEER